jgi:plastocyanin
MKSKNILSAFIFCFLFSTAIDSCSKSSGYGGSGGSGGGGTGGTTVNISGMSFSPSSITVKVGITVKWTNNDYITHTVTSNDGTTFNSGNVAAGGSFSFTPTVAGNFPYHCNIHTGMTGTLVVTN